MPEKVIEDCTQALRLDRTYIKALNRRAAVKEQKGDEASLYEALCDYTAAAILGQFANQQASESVDRLMKRLSAEQAQKILKVASILTRACCSTLMLKPALLLRNANLDCLLRLS